MYNLCKLNQHFFPSLNILLESALCKSAENNAAQTDALLVFVQTSAFNNNGLLCLSAKSCFALVFEERPFSYSIVCMDASASCIVAILCLARFLPLSKL